MILIYAEDSAKIEGYNWKPLGLVATQHEAEVLCQSYAQQRVQGAYGDWHLAWIALTSSVSLDEVYRLLHDHSWPPWPPVVGRQGNDETEDECIDRQAEEERQARRNQQYMQYRAKAVWLNAPERALGGLIADERDNQT